jgi:ankyrin repeat protein
MELCNAIENIKKVTWNTSVYDLISDGSAESLNKRNKYGKTPYLLACEKQMDGDAYHIQIHPLCTTQNTPDNYNNTPFSIMCRHGSIDQIKCWFLKNPKFDVETMNYQNNDGNTPLLIRCMSFRGEKDELLDFIIYHPKCTTLDTANNKGETPLWWLCRNNLTNLALQVLAHPELKSINKPNNYGQTPFWWARHKDNKILMEAFLKHPKFYGNHKC